jgi:hypothetical protein
MMGMLRLAEWMDKKMHATWRALKKAKSCVTAKLPRLYACRPNRANALCKQGYA